jgi:hypothetical protein
LKLVPNTLNPLPFTPFTNCNAFSILTHVTEDSGVISNNLNNYIYIQ